MPSASNDSPMLESALWWAARGMPVFPVYEIGRDGKCSCGPTEVCTKKDTAGKHPRIERWTIYATTEEDQIRSWWTRWPNANVGICCGQDLPGGGYLLVVDEDPRHDGDLTLAGLEQQYGSLPETPRNLTGGGGHHIFLRSNRRVKSRSNSLGAGVDVKCSGGYVLAPPSSHKSGGRYAIDAGASIEDVPIAPAPDWLLVLADPPAAQTRSEVRGADAFIEGGRHDAMVSLAGVLRRRGLTGAEMLPTMKAVNETRCKPPLDEHEVKTIAYSANWEAADPLGGGQAEGLAPELPFDEIWTDEPEANLIVPSLGITPGPVHLVTGSWYTGKTLFLATMGLSVASGKDLFGVWRTQRSKWIHFDHEMGRRHLKRYVKRLRTGLGVDIEDLRGWMSLRPLPRLNLRVDNAVDHYTEYLRGYSLCTIDPLRAAAPGADENKSEFREFLDMLAIASERTGCAIVVLHHGGKPVEGAERRNTGRGTSAIDDAVQTKFVLTAKEKGAPILVSHEKTRELNQPLSDFFLEIESTDAHVRLLHREPEQLRQQAAASQDVRKEVVTMKAVEQLRAIFLRKNGRIEASREEIRDVSHMNTKLFDLAWSTMKISGSIVPEGTRQKPAYRLASGER